MYETTLNCIASWMILWALLIPRALGQVSPVFPAARTGGNYMHNYYLPPPSTTPWYPAWSPNGEGIAFSMQGSIWKIRLVTTTAYELTAAATYDSSPAWSPDGQWHSRRRFPRHQSEDS
jgi:hypothetical protein